MDHSVHSVIDEVLRMIRTGSSKKTVSSYIIKLYKNKEISSKVYCILLDMFIENH